MELKDTVKLMLSDHWQDRLKAEYLQLDIRIKKLEVRIEFLTKEARQLGASRIELMFLRRQIKHMKKYRQELEARLMLQYQEAREID